ncbi:MAG: hypothetical protein N4A38_00480 [Candidatus Gracilibacteria bacterium]|nr:hypothetical protein [Candidatus Gracilibacteria bacterium]
MQKNIKMLLFIIPTLIILGLVFIYGYNYYLTNKEEQEKIKIDEYNFEQLEKVKSVLNSLDKNSYSFDNIGDFNKQFNINIEPIKNCYYLSNKNGGEKYIFGFKLESNKYIDKYGTKSYIYPKYDIVKEEICLGMPDLDGSKGKGCWDGNRDLFERIISNPCEDD